MFKVDSFVFYVESIEISKKFYAFILERDGDVLSPTFVSFPLAGGAVELKQLAQVSPPASITGGGAELSLEAESLEALQSLFKHWESNGVKFVQNPTELMFGTTFVAIDPDGHRIRAFASNK